MSDYKGMTNAERAGATKERLIAMKTAVADGVMDRSEYAWYIICILTNYIKKIITDNHYNVSGLNERDDYMHVAFMAVLNKLSTTLNRRNRALSFCQPSRKK